MKLYANRLYFVIVLLTILLVVFIAEYFSSYIAFYTLLIIYTIFAYAAGVLEARLYNVRKVYKTDL